MANPKSPHDAGVLIRAENGDVIRFDDTGLSLRLSDWVLQDIADRLDREGTPGTYVDAAVLGDIDAWGVRDEGDHFRFFATLPGMAPGREYLKFKAGGGHYAATGGPILGVLSLGGARRESVSDQAASWARNIVCPADDLGAVGHGGDGTPSETEFLEPAKEMTRDVAAADAMLRMRAEEGRALPLFFTRCETDHSTSLGALATGAAYSNVIAAARNLTQAAASLGKRAHVLSVSIDFAGEDTSGDPVWFLKSFQDLMKKLETDLAALGFRAPFFVQSFDCGGAEGGEVPLLDAQWQLAMDHATQTLAFSAPSYLYQFDRFERPEPHAIVEMGRMDAAAIEALSARVHWFCPTLLLARSRGREVKITAQSMAPLVIDASDPFDCGPGQGFSVDGVEITDVRLDPDDPHGLLIGCSAVPEPGALLRYASGAEARQDGRPANRGNVRDDWQLDPKGAPHLARFALPAVLGIYPE